VPYFPAPLAPSATSPSTVTIHLVQALRGGRGGTRSGLSWADRERKDSRESKDLTTAKKRKKNLKSRMRWKLKQNEKRTAAKALLDSGDPAAVAAHEKKKAESRKASSAGLGKARKQALAKRKPKTGPTKLTRVEQALARSLRQARVPHDKHLRDKENDRLIGKMSKLHRDRRAASGQCNDKLGVRRIGPLMATHRSPSALAKLFRGETHPDRAQCPRVRDGAQCPIHGDPATCPRHGRSPTAAETNLLCDAVETLREHYGPQQISTFITDAMAVAKWKFSQSLARRLVAEWEKRRWLPNRVAPALDRVDDAKRLRFARKYQAKDPAYWKTQVVFADCKSFDVRTTAKAKMKGRARTFLASYRRKNEGLKKSCLRVNNFAAKGSTRVKVFAAAADGKMLVWEDYSGRTWDGELAVEMTRKLEAVCRARWPERHTLLLLHDNDPSMKSQENKVQELASGFSLVRIPPRSPDLNSLDYAHWDAIEARMQAWERAHYDPEETPAAYKARLERTALNLPSEIIDKAHGQMAERIVKLLAAQGGKFEEGGGKLCEAMRARKRKWSEEELLARHTRWLQEANRYGGGFLRKLLDRHAQPARPRQLNHQQKAAHQAHQASQEASQGASQKQSPLPKSSSPPATPDPPSKKPAPSSKKSSETPWQAYQRRFRFEFPNSNRNLLLDAGQLASGGQGNACLWLSTCVAMSRVAESEWPAAGVSAQFDAIRAHLRAIGKIPTRGLGYAGRTTNDDRLGRAAAALRESVCAWMLSGDGVREMVGFYERFRYIADADQPEKKRDSYPGLVWTGGRYYRDSGQTYSQFVQGARTTDFADEHHLRALSRLLGVRIVVVQQCANVVPLPPAHDPPSGNPHFEIVLANDDVHYQAFVPRDRR